MGKVFYNNTFTGLCCIHCELYLASLASQPEKHEMAGNVASIALWHVYNSTNALHWGSKCQTAVHPGGTFGAHIITLGPDTAPPPGY